MKTIPQLEEIYEFQCLSEYERFVLWINKFVRDGAIEEIDVSERYIGATVFSERWFKDKSTGLIWRLVAPDFPFKGTFEQVKAQSSFPNFDKSWMTKP